MKDFRRLFVIENGEVAGWTESRHTAFVLAVESDWLTMTVKAGRNPFTKEVNTAFGRFLKEYEEAYGKVERFERRHCYRFVFREGSSGCQTTFIEIDKGDGFPERKPLLNMSCYGKCAGMDMFVYDFLDLCVAGNFFKMEDGCYSYAEEEDEFGKGVEMKSIRPRLTDYEEGWNGPSEIASRVVSIRNIVRDVPEESEGPLPSEGEIPSEDVE